MSSGEAELYGCVKTASRLLGIAQLLRDLGMDRFGMPKLELETDSSAAKGIAVKRGAGKVRHIETGALWIQQAVGLKKFALLKIDGKTNAADLMTKVTDHQTLVKHLTALGMVFR